MENKPVRLLIVEDSEEDMLLLSRQLKREGLSITTHRVDNARDMRDALRSESFDAVLSDHNMPQFDAFGALEVLRETGQDLPFVVVSASIGEETAVEMMRLGAHDFVMKDNFTRLAPVIRRELREAQNRRERRQALDALRARNEELETLNKRLRLLIESSKNIAACPNIKTLAKQALQEFAELMAAEGGSFFLAEDDGLELVCSLDPGHSPAKIPFPLRPDSVLGRVWETKAPLVISDIAAENKMTRSGWAGYQNGSLLALPLRTGPDDVIGIVTLHNKLDHPFVSQDREIGMILGSLFCQSQRVAVSAETLRKSEEAFRALAENSLDAIMRFDADCQHLYVNPAVERQTGIRAETFLGKTHHDLGFPEKLCTLWEEAIRKVFREKQVNRLEFQLPTGLWIDWLLMPEFDHEGEVVTVVTSARDITQRRRMEEDRRRLMAAIEQAAEIFVITDAKGVIEYVNPAFEAVTGYSRIEARGQKPSILKSGKHDDAFYRELWTTIASGKTWRGRLHNKRKDGSHFIENATISPVRNQDGEIVNYVGVKHDITHEVELENQLRQAQKMEAIGHLAGGIAHDFNNILGAIIGYTELLQDQAKCGARPQWSYLDEVLRAGERAKDLVRQILTFSRQTEQDKRPARVGPIVKEALKLLRGALPSTIAIDQQILTESDTVIADATQIHQVVMNLCTNASQAMPNGGRLTIRLEAAELDPKDAPLYPDLHAGPYLRLVVADTGSGIALEHLERIFEPFFTTKERSGGTGMGLAVVHGIVKTHGGTISVRSEFGRGTTFEILLPRVALEESPLAESVEPLPHGTERILVVDDEKALREVMECMLRSLGYAVKSVENAADALELLTRSEGAFDLVITDLTMPVMTGPELAARLARAGSTLPVLLCTGHGERTDMDEDRPSGLSEILRKPISMYELALAVRTALDADKG